MIELVSALVPPTALSEGGLVSASNVYAVLQHFQACQTAVSKFSKIHRDSMTGAAWVGFLGSLGSAKGNVGFLGSLVAAKRVCPTDSTEMA